MKFLFLLVAMTSPAFSQNWDYFDVPGLTWKEDGSSIEHALYTSSIWNIDSNGKVLINNKERANIEIKTSGPVTTREFRNGIKLFETIDDKENIKTITEKNGANYRVVQFDSSNKPQFIARCFIEENNYYNNCLLASNDHCQEVDKAVQRLGEKDLRKCIELNDQVKTLYEITFGDAVRDRLISEMKRTGMDTASAIVSTPMGNKLNTLPVTAIHRLYEASEFCKGTRQFFPVKLNTSSKSSELSNSTDQ